MSGDNSRIGKIHAAGKQLLAEINGYGIFLAAAEKSESTAIHLVADNFWETYPALLACSLYK